MSRIVFIALLLLVATENGSLGQIRNSADDKANRSVVESQQGNKSEAPAAAPPVAEPPVAEPPATAQAAPGPEPRFETTPAKIHAWVMALEADRFAVREAATAHLIAAGEAAISPVTEAILQGGLETITRGLTVLRELALRETRTAELAQVSLERIAGMRITTAAARAVATLRSIEGIRHERALAMLSRLGAQVSELPEVGVLAGAELYIVIDDRWHGQLSDLRLLGWLSEVSQVHVTLAGKAVTNIWIDPLLEMKNLVQLLISRTQIDDDGLRKIATMPRLHALMLRYNPMTDAGLASIPEAQRQDGRTTLRLLQIYGTAITRDAVAALETTMTETQFDHRRGAFLGIGPDARFPNNCVVGRVEPHQAAARAGVQQFDIIVKYHGQDVTTFDTLTKLIAENSAGDRVKMKLLRDEKEIEIEVELGEWP